MSLFSFFSDIFGSTKKQNNLYDPDDLMDPNNPIGYLNPISPNYIYKDDTTDNLNTGIDPVGTNDNFDDPFDNF